MARLGSRDGELFFEKAVLRPPLFLSSSGKALGLGKAPEKRVAILQTLAAHSFRQLAGT